MDDRIKNGITNCNEIDNIMKDANTKISRLETRIRLWSLCNTDLVTTEDMYKTFNDIPSTTIDNWIHDYGKEEHIKYGLKKYKPKELEEIFTKLNISFVKRGARGTSTFIFEDNRELKVPNSGVLLGTKNNLLLLGMELTGSKIAEDIREDILNIVDDSPEAVIRNLNKLSLDVEKEKLSMMLLEAIMSGDKDEECNIKTQICGIEHKKVKLLGITPPYTMRNVAGRLKTHESKIYSLLNEFEVIYKPDKVDSIIILKNDIFKFDEYYDKYVFTAYGLEWFLGRSLVKNRFKLDI